MELKDLIQHGLTRKPPRIILHGPHGIGKSSFGAQAPAPIFLPTEDGLTMIDVPHFPVPKTLDEVWDDMSALIKEDHEYKTFIVDTLDWLERLIWARVCQDNKCESIEDLGYGRGYVFAMSYWEKFFKGLDKLRDCKNMAIILLAHNEIKPYNPPDSQPYDRYQIKLHKSAAAKGEEWADAVLFAGFKVYVKTEKGKQSGKATGGERVVYTQPNPAYRAKNRYNLPEEMNFNFNTIMERIKNNGKSG
jgi:hypothetical protein